MGEMSDYIAGLEAPDRDLIERIRARAVSLVPEAVEGRSYGMPALRYRDAGFSWNPQTYSCAVKRGEPDWLNFVDTALREAITGVEFATYSASFEKWFGEAPPAPQIGFPSELR